MWGLGFGGPWVIWPVFGLFMVFMMGMMVLRAVFGRQRGARWSLMALGVMVMLVGLALIVVVLAGSDTARQGSAATGPFMGPGMMGRGMGPGVMGEGYAPPPAVSPLPTATPGGDTTVSYRHDVQPVFDRDCVVCHGGSSGLWLDGYERVLAGGSGGPVVTPGDPEASELYRRITGQSQPTMPLNGASLSSADVEIIRTWIAEGAPNN